MRDFELQLEEDARARAIQNLAQAVEELGRSQAATAERDRETLAAGLGEVAKSIHRLAEALREEGR